MQEKKSSLNFEQSLTELNHLVEKMEQGGLSLQESLKSFEEGIHLIRQCQQELTAAEQKIKILTEKQELETFQADRDENE